MAQPPLLANPVHARSDRLSVLAYNAHREVDVAAAEYGCRTDQAD
jgi:hypothetical protein